MTMSSRLLKLCNEFFSDLSPAAIERNPSLAEDVEGLVDYLSDRVTDDDDVDEAALIADVRDQLTMIWSEIDLKEKASNPLLSSHYEEVQENLDYFEQEARPAGFTDDGAEAEDDPDPLYLSEDHEPEEMDHA